MLSSQEGLERSKPTQDFVQVLYRLMTEHVRAAVQCQYHICIHVALKSLHDCCCSQTEGVAQACAVKPCASTWLGAGIAYLRLQEYQNAEMALMEANVMNNRHAEVWGYLALLALHIGQEAEAEQAMTWANRCELSNVQLLDEVGEQYMTMGR